LIIIENIKERDLDIIKSKNETIRKILLKTLKNIKKEIRLNNESDKFNK